MSSVSVVVPAFNEEERIEQCLDSILAQSRLPDEVIVVDNGSTDSTAQIVQRYAKQSPIIRCVFEERPGITYARKAGYDAATSELIIRTDADSIAGPTWVESFVDFMDSEAGQAYVCAAGPIIFNDGPARERMENLILRGANKTGGDSLALPGGNCGFRKLAYLRISDRLLDRSDIWEDMDVFVNLREDGGKCRIVPGMLVQTSTRQLGYSPWVNRKYITGGFRTALAMGNNKFVAMSLVDLIPRIIMYTVLWLIVGPWDETKRNWRPHRLLRSRPRSRVLVTSRDGRADTAGP